MQEFLPIIKTTLLEWAQLTLANPLYAATLAIAIGVLAAVVCSVKSMPLKRKAAASETARVELLTTLSLAQQRTDLLQEQLTQRNQQIAGTLRTLIASFDLAETPPPADEDLQADDLWGQHERVIAGLATRLRAEQHTAIELRQAYQTETGRLAEKEVLIDALQKTLTEKARQITRLEQQLGEIVEKHAVDSARLTELEQQTLEWLNTRQQLEALEEKLTAKEAEFEQMQKEAEVRQDTETGLDQPQLPVETAQVNAEVEEDPQPATITLSVESEPEAQPATNVSESTGITGRLKNLFGKPKQEPAAAVVEDTAEIPRETPSADVEIQPETVAEEQPSISFAQSQIGKIKSLFAKPKPDTQAISLEAADAAEPPQTDVQSEPVDEGERSSGTSQSQFGKIKNLLGLSRQEAVIAEAEAEEPVLAEAAAGSEEADTGDSSVSFAKSQIGKIKNLFGMAK